MINNKLNELNLTIDQKHKINLFSEPHALICGATGSGKSYMLRTIIADLVNSGNVYQLYVIDNKSVDYTYLNLLNYKDNSNFTIKQKLEILKRNNLDLTEKEYKALQYLTYIEVVDRAKIENDYILTLLNDLTKIMRRRYAKLEKFFATDLKELHDISPKDSFGHIVVVVDELADLMYYDKDKTRDRNLRGLIEKKLVEIATLGRACGIHLILATQRPSADILSGQLRANIPIRVCLGAVSNNERNIILGRSSKEYSNRVMLARGELVNLCPIG